MIRNCINCQIEFDTLINKKVSCKRQCSLAYRYKTKYGNQYVFKYRSASPRNFLQSLAKKVKSRRDLSVDNLFELYEKQKGLCALSGREMTYISGKGRIPTNISIDRIDNTIGYEIDNIQLVCRQANQMKMELTHLELSKWCNDIVVQLNKRK